MWEDYCGSDDFERIRNKTRAAHTPNWCKYNQQGYTWCSDSQPIPSDHGSHWVVIRFVV